MENAIVVAGRIADPTHIELEEPLTTLEGKVEVIIRSAGGPRQDREDILDLIFALPAGRRSKQDIDSQIDTERSSWEKS